MEIDADGFERLVTDALELVPEPLAKMIDNVAFFIEDWPTPAQMAGRSGTLLGLYEGVDLTRRSSSSYMGAMPDRIWIFRGPISRLARSEAELAQLVTTTVIHEVAHHFGISDKRLHELGWA